MQGRYGTILVYHPILAFYYRVSLYIIGIVKISSVLSIVTLSDALIPFSYRSVVFLKVSISSELTNDIWRGH